MKELLEILSTPYQLTEYREDWPNGKKGCLFYIPEIEEFGHGLGTICLIDAWWRKDDEIGLYNELHQCEWELAAENCIIRGYGAFLIRLGWIERNFEAVPERWELYCKWEDEVKKLPWHHPMERIAEECDNWLRRDDEVLQSYLQDKEDSGSFMYLTMRDTIRYTVKQVIDDIPTMMWKMQPVIKWDLKNNGYGSWATYYHELDIMMSGGKDFVEFGGFRASMLNYFSAHYVCQKVLEEEDEHKAAEWVRNGFYHYDDDVEHTITLNDIPFVFNGLDIETVYECYRTIREEKIITRLKSKFKFAYCSDEEKKEQILHEMLFYESIWFPDNEMAFVQYMSKATKDNLHQHIFHYMLSLILQYQGTCSEEDKNIMLECFPEEMSLMYLVAQSDKETQEKLNRDDTREENNLSFIWIPEKKDEVLKKLNTYIQGKSKPIDVMMPIRAAMEAGVIGRPTYRQVQYAFPDYCPNNKSSVSKYTNEEQYKYYGEAYKRMVEDFRTLF